MHHIKLALVAIACFILVVTAYNVFDRWATDSSLSDYKIGEMQYLDIHSNPEPLSPVLVQLEDGTEMSIDAGANKVRLINIWASWCAPCIKEMPALDRLQANLGGDDFEVIAINVDRQGVAKAREYLDDLELENLKLYADPTMKAAYQYSDGRLPMTHIIDKNGNVVASFLGPLDWDSRDALALFTYLIGDET